MKKIVLGVSAIAAISAMAIESANVVGYVNTSARQGFNFYTPTFRNVGEAGDIDIQEIQMGSSVGAMGANLQLIASDGTSAAYYSWFDPATAKDFGYTDGSKGCWVNEDMSQLETPVMLKVGSGVQIDTELGSPVVNAGQVDDSDVAFVTRGGFNYIGNSFPTDLDIQNIQVSKEIGAMGANLQVIAADGTSAAYYSWFDAATAKDFGYTDGAVGCWVNEDMSQLETPVILAAGETIQIDTEADATVTVLSPIEL